MLSNKDWMNQWTCRNIKMIITKYLFMKALLIKNQPFNNLKWNKSKMKIWSLKKIWKKRVKEDLNQRMNTRIHLLQIDSQVYLTKNIFEILIKSMFMIT
jgi:hypothetical protein